MTQAKPERRGGARLALALIAAVCALAAAVAGAVAADDAETGTFGQDGIASHSLGVHYFESGFSSLLARADGGLVAARDEQLESYLANGALDPAAPPRPVSPYYKVFPVAGGRSLVLDESKLTRLNADGSVDASFGGGAVEMGSPVSAAAELASGKVLVAGINSGGTKVTTSWVTVELFNPDGSIEGALGHEGTLTLPLTYRSEGESRPRIAPTEDGGALVAGGSFLLRLGPDGSPNPSFGGDGMVEPPTRLVGGRVLPDGSVMAVGWERGASGGGGDLAVLRYNGAGNPDPAFGPEGVRRFDFGGDEVATVSSWAADGSVIVGGRSTAQGPCSRSSSCEEVPLLAAFDPAGNLDPGFGQGGGLKLAALAAAPASFQSGGVAALARRPDGSIVAAGTTAPALTVAFLAAFSPQGALLPGFGEGGIVRMRQPAPATHRLVGLAPLENGKLLAAGTTNVGVDDQPVLIRYAADGGLDRSFGGGAGYVAAASSGEAMGFAADGSGQVLIGIYGYPRSKVMRLSAADGAPEPSFGSAGVVSLPRLVRVKGVGLAPDGGAIVVGVRDPGGPEEPGLVLRYRSNGKLDRGFGKNGEVALAPGGREVRAKALVVGADGRSLVGGVAGPRFAITRLLPDGRPDPRFGARGWLLPSADGIAKSLTLIDSGPNIYLAGVVRAGDGHRAVLMRFGNDGRPDRSFGHRGRLSTAISKPAQAKAIVPSDKGVLVVLGGGPKPLLFFGRNGKVQRRSLEPNSPRLENVRATVSEGQLILGWRAYSPELRRDVNYLAQRSLDGR